MKDKRTGASLAVSARQSHGQILGKIKARSSVSALFFFFGWDGAEGIGKGVRVFF